MSAANGGVYVQGGQTRAGKNEVMLVCGNVVPLKIRSSIKGESINRVS